MSTRSSRVIAARAVLLSNVRLLKGLGHDANAMAARMDTRLACNISSDPEGPAIKAVAEVLTATYQRITVHPDAPGYIARHELGGLIRELNALAKG